MLLDFDIFKNRKFTYPASLNKTIKRLQTPVKLVYTPVSWPLFVSVVLAQSLLIILIFSLLFYQIYFLDRVYIGVYSDSIDVSALTRQEVRRLVAHQTNVLLQRQITLVSPEQTWSMTAAELGARVDLEQTVDQIFKVGRTGYFFTDFRTQVQVAQDTVNVQPVITFDADSARNKLAQIAQQLNRPPRNARLYLDDDLQVNFISPEAGQHLDSQSAREAIWQAVVLRGPATIHLELEYLQPTITEFEPTRTKVQQLLDQPLKFTFGDRQWAVEPVTLAGLLSFEQKIEADGTGHIIAHMNPAPLYTYFQTLAAEINQEPVNAWFHLDVSSWSLQPIVSSRNRVWLDVESAVAITLAQLDAPNSAPIPLPVTVQAPAVSMDNVANLGIRELVSSSTSYFKGSSDERMQNIAVAAAKFHGLVIPPGEVFSFNQYLGDVTAENGFAESLIIQGDRTAVGIGGGVCQVSTTVFRAAFFGGFEIVERWAHGYRVSWYETGSNPGLDATIYSPWVDLKFRNDTGSYILIQTYADLAAGTVTFNFYGTSPGRSVIVSDPVEANHVPHGPPVYEEDASLIPGETKQIDWARDGVDVTVYRTVMQDGQVIHQDSIFSQYRPWQAVYKIGPQ